MYDSVEKKHKPNNIPCCIKNLLDKLKRLIKILTGDTKREIFARTFSFIYFIVPHRKFFNCALSKHTKDNMNVTSFLNYNVIIVEGCNLQYDMRKHD